MTKTSIQHYCCIMIPDFVIIPSALWPLLPVGIHLATIKEVEDRFANNAGRKRLFSGLIKGLNELKAAGCPQVFLDGSYVTGKPNPKDYDLCWDPTGVDPAKLDPIIWHPVYLRAPRSEQQGKYYGDYFQSTTQDNNTGKTFLDFFQIDRDGNQKGIINIKLKK